MGEPVFLLALTIAATTVVVVVRSIAGVIGGRGASRAEMAEMNEQLQQHAAALEEAEASLALQSTQLAEFQERLDFAERLLAQRPDRSALGPGKEPG